ncbi:MAG TPA: hypothetical protein VFS33_09615 [Gemmatimonadales bacterium]|nr:hypothetical protein [Gemmatimonadales bacterium]
MSTHRLSGEFVDPMLLRSDRTDRAGRGTPVANRTAQFAQLVRKLFQPLR